jgi:hypothetical protein
LTDYFDRVETQLVQRADALYPASAGGSLSPGGRVRGVRPPRGRRAEVAALDLAGPGRHSLRRTPDALVGMVLGAAGGLVAALIMLLGASPATPDFSVSRGKGRLVTISAAAPSSVAALNNRLASLGIPIRAANVRSDCAAPVQMIGSRSTKPRTLDAARMPLVFRRLKGDRGALLSVRVAPPSRAGQTLVLAAGGSGAALVGELITGSPPACIRGPRRGHALLGALS